MSPGNQIEGDVYLEFHTVGRQVKVTAIHANTGIEVVIFGPASTPPDSLKKLAAQKLQRRIEREEGNQAEPGSGTFA
ncbi:DUF6898 family protein [Roseibium algae]|uniref:Serine hydroxymethyltransferase n=1 Tax=Roseibium algae TaxID=3123038 RepID=A0ABU8TJ58_9HYPH